MNKFILSLVAVATMATTNIQSAQARIDGADILNFIITLDDILHNDYQWYPGQGIIYCSERFEGVGYGRQCVQTCHADYVECKAVFPRRNGLQREVFYARGADEASCYQNAMNRCYSSVHQDYACRFARHSYDYGTQFVSRNYVSSSLCGVHTLPPIIHDLPRHHRGRRGGLITRPPHRGGNHVKPDRWRP